jgi:hypothetical protein
MILGTLKTIIIIVRNSALFQIGYLNRSRIRIIIELLKILIAIMESN